jgi:hypothetical protein
VVLGQPVAVVPEPLADLRELEGLMDGVGRVRPLRTGD